MKRFVENDCALIYINYKYIDNFLNEDYKHANIVVTGFEDDIIYENLMSLNFSDNIYIEVPYVLSCKVKGLSRMIYKINIDTLESVLEFKKNGFEVVNIESYYNITLSLDLNEDAIDLFLEILKGYTELKFIIDFCNLEDKKYEKYWKIYTFVDDSENMYLSRSNMLTVMLLNHPCNMCLCNGKKCHGNKSKYPKKYKLMIRQMFMFMEVRKK